MAIKRRIKKTKSPGTIKRKKARKAARPAKKVLRRPKARKAPSIPKEAKELFSHTQTAVERTKFFTVEAPPKSRSVPQDLPAKYGQDKIILQVRDPWWIYAYWEVRPQTLDKLKNELGDIFYRAKRILRAYDISLIDFNGTNAHRFFDIEVGGHSDNWYIDTASPGRSWCVDLGLLLPDGRFIMIVRSNTVTTPIDGPSWITDEEWMIPDDMFARLYGMGFGFGRSSPVGKGWQEKIKKAIFLGVSSSRAVTSLSSPVRRAPSTKKP